MPRTTPGWVLQATRRYGPDPHLRSGAVFAAGGHGLAGVHRSQVSRWESGSSAVSEHVAQRYERLCGTPPGQVVAAVELAFRMAPPSMAGGPLRRPRPEDPIRDVQALLERALEGEVMTGSDWDRLSWLLAGLPSSLLRHRDWQALADRGLTEMSVTTGLAYEQRAVAMARIAGHPLAGAAVTLLVEDILGDPRSQIYSEAACLLQFVQDQHEAGRVLRRVAEQPVSRTALRAALFVGGVLSRQGTLDQDDALGLTRVAYARCRASGESYLVRRAAASLLLAIPARVRHRLVGAVASSEEDIDLRSMLAGEGPLDAAAQRATVRRVEQHLAEVFGPSAYEDPGLASVLRQLARETNDEDRSHVLQLLMLLPLGRHVGDAYVEELRLALDGGDLRRCHEAVSVLLCVTPGRNVDLVAGLSTGSCLDAVDPQLSMEASWALGNAKFDHPEVDPVADAVADAVRAALDGSRPATPDQLRGWAYALGMRGHDDLLTSLVPEPGVGAGTAAEVHGVWATARAWWLGLPAYLHPDRCPDRHRFGRH